MLRSGKRHGSIEPAECALKRSHAYRVAAYSSTQHGESTSMQCTRLPIVLALPGCPIGPRPGCRRRLTRRSRPDLAERSSILLRHCGPQIQALGCDALRFFQMAFILALSAFFWVADIDRRFERTLLATVPVSAASALFKASSSRSRRWISLLIARSAGFIACLPQRWWAKSLPVLPSRRKCRPRRQEMEANGT